MSLRRACGSRHPLSRPKRAFHSSVPGVKRPTSFLFQRGQPTSAALARSREAGTARPLISSVSVSVWKWNWLFTQARTAAGTYSSQIAGGSTMWLSQSKTGKDFVAIGTSCRGPTVHLRGGGYHEHEPKAQGPRRHRPTRCAPALLAATARQRRSRSEAHSAAHALTRALARPAGN